MMDDYSHIFMLESENQALRDEITMWRYRITVEDRLLHYIPAAVIDECVAVLDHGEVKHPGEEWKKVSPHIHMLAAEGHINQLSIEGREREEESGCYHLAHALVRYMMALAQFMGAAK
ncbi:MAG TPA: dATP/dGTP diphosphohydrolase domain-containing protein [Dissulfurispiraceae bacterium]|nr:dATP/dGTP diphosphohydrolase domain-containing protein [Dissulfurispiraceae bacterium]